MLHTGLPYNPVILLRGKHPREMKTHVHAKTCMQKLICIQHYEYDHKVEMPKCLSPKKWINQIWSTYTREYPSITKRNEAPIYPTTWLNTENIVSERSVTQKTT